jgi:hypothetical protein
VTEREDSRPWYRHFWVWFLMVPPAATVVFWAVILATTAASPALVVDDHSKVGLAYEQQQARDAVAARRGLAGRVHVARDEGTVTVVLTGVQQAPDRLRLTLAHPTEAGRDRHAILRREGSALYRGRLDGPAPNRRYVEIHPVAGDWRLAGELPAHRSDLGLSPPRGLAEH